MTTPFTCRDRGEHRSGFTLVEMVIVIVITAIIGAIVAIFIRAPVQTYVDSVARAELTDVADLAIRRLARDIRLALPNSIRIQPNGNDVYLELLLTKTGGRYLAEEDNVAGNILDFSDSTKVQFDVVGSMPGSLPNEKSQLVVNGDQIVIYNLGPGLAPADAYAGGNRASVNVDPDPNSNTITLSANPFALQSPRLTSPSHRFQVVTTPVTYVCSGNVLRRYWGYPIQPAQPLDISAAPLSSGATNRALLADGIVACRLDYGTLANVRSALVGITLTLQKGNSGQITLFHQVHVDNTP
jgi:MSHA biogenesis protein MshO